MGLQEGKGCRGFAASPRQEIPPRVAHLGSFKIIFVCLPIDKFS